MISARMQPSIQAQEAELTKASKMANNAISAIDTVKSFNGQDFEKWQYAGAIKKAAKHYLVEAQANAQQIGFVRFVTLGLFVQGFWYGSHLVNTGHKNPGDILTCFWACLTATQSVEQILPQLLVLEKGRAAGATLKATIVQMERGRRVVSMLGGNKPPHCDGDIEVRNVCLLKILTDDCAESTLGVVLLPFAARQTCAPKCRLFLCCRRHDVRSGEKWIRKEHAGKSTLALLHPQIWRGASRRSLCPNASCGLAPQ